LVLLNEADRGGDVTIRVSVAPSILTWARERSGIDPDALRKRFPKLPQWEAGESAPTMRQLEQFALATHTPVGFMFLTEPPEERLPVRDFRTIRDARVVRPSPDLLETIYLSEQRQEWYRDYLRNHTADPLPFIGSVNVGSSPVTTAERMRDLLGFDLATRRQFSNWTAALKGLIEAAEAAGVLVLVNGVVGSNTHRKLNPEEFRGFALADELAPLVFLNGADTKAAQIFTLAHELTHLWAGQSGVDRPELDRADDDHSATERWCNAVAAEFLVPLDSMPERLTGPTLTDDLERLARQYKVSTLVVLRRLVDKRLLGWHDFEGAFKAELKRVKALAARSGDGGDFYNTTPYRVSRRFARAIITDALEGETLYRDAYRLLGVRTHQTFQNLGEKLGVA
jgi:Zn-dependent peptidase ImmA (M78 family)